MEAEKRKLFKMYKKIMATEKEQRLMQQEIIAEKKSIEDGIHQNKADPVKNASNMVPTPIRVDDPQQEKESKKLSTSSTPPSDPSRDYTLGSRCIPPEGDAQRGKGLGDSIAPMSSSNPVGEGASESSMSVDKPKKRTKKSRWDNNFVQPSASTAPAPLTPVPADAPLDSAQSRKRKRKQRWSQPVGVPASDDAQAESKPPFKRLGPTLPSKPRPDFQPPNPPNRRV